MDRDGGLALQWERAGMIWWRGVSFVTNRIEIKSLGIFPTSSEHGKWRHLMKLYCEQLFYHITMLRSCEKLNFPGKGRHDLVVGVFLQDLWEIDGKILPGSALELRPLPGPYSLRKPPSLGAVAEILSNSFLDRGKKLRPTLLHVFS